MWYDDGLSIINGGISMKHPTNKEKIKRYEDLFHAINLAVVACNNDLINIYIRQIDSWSYAHRIGNGQLPESRQKRIITNAFYRLGETDTYDEHE